MQWYPLQSIVIHYDYTRGSYLFAVGVEDRSGKSVYSPADDLQKCSQDRDTVDSRSLRKPRFSLWQPSPLWRSGFLPAGLAYSDTTYSVAQGREASAAAVLTTFDVPPHPAQPDSGR